MCSSLCHTSIHENLTFHSKQTTPGWNIESTSNGTWLKRNIFILLRTFWFLLFESFLCSEFHLKIGYILRSHFPCRFTFVSGSTISKTSIICQNAPLLLNNISVLFSTFEISEWLLQIMLVHWMSFFNFFSSVLLNRRLTAEKCVFLWMISREKVFCYFCSCFFLCFFLYNYL